MRVLKPSIVAKPGDSILLRAAVSGEVIGLFAALKRFDPNGNGTDVSWDSAVLEGPGGRATVANVSGYDVYVFPEVGEEGTVSLTLDVGTTTRKAKLASDEEAVWRIFVPTPAPAPPEGGE
jgi:hypothetical protein